MTQEEFPEIEVEVQAVPGKYDAFRQLDKGYYELGLVLRIGIPRIMDVTKHDINNIYDSTSHVIHFKNGGWARIAYTSSGALTDFELLSAKIVIIEAGVGVVQVISPN